MYRIEGSKFNYTEYLVKKSFINEPKYCKCGKSSFSIQYDVAKYHNVYLDAIITVVKIKYQ